MNSGNNTTGFTTGYSAGSPTLVSNGTDLVESNGGTWDFLPVAVTGNFEISFQVYNNSGDGDSHFLLLNPGTDAGIDVRNSPAGTDTPNINIFSGTNFADYFQYFFPETDSNNMTLASAPDKTMPVTYFPNDAWTQITISRVGNLLIDDVGGQVIGADLTGLGISNTLDLGLGGYATTLLGGTGQILFRDIDIIPEPSTPALCVLGGLVFLLQAAVKRRRLRQGLITA